MRILQLFRPFLLFLCFLIPPIFGTSSNNASDKIFFLIYNQQFSEAEKELNLAKPVLSNLHFILLDIDLSWWKAIANNSKADFDLLEKKLSGYSNTVVHGTKSLEELVIVSYQFRLAAKRNQYFRMLHFFWNINRIVEQPELKDLPPDGKDIFNLYKAIFLYGKSKISLLGSKMQNENLGVLKNYASSSIPINQTIAEYFLARIYIETENLPAEAKPYYENLCEMYPGNKVFAKYLKMCQNIK